MNQTRIVTLVVGALLLAGCASGPDSPRADVPRAETLTAGLNQAGYEIFHAVAEQDDSNIVMSPLSIGMAFGMVDLGATDHVADELQGLFRYPVDGDDLWSAFHTLEKSFQSDPELVPSPSEGGNRDQRTPPTLSLVNREFLDPSFSPLASYQEGLERWFDSAVETLDLQGDPDGSRERVNAWVDDATHGLIPELLPDGFISDVTTMILVNALYLKASWEMPFVADWTFPDEFTRLDGSIVSVPFMFGELGPLSVTEGEGYLAIDLPFAYSDLSMLVIVPDTGRYSQIETSLDEDFVDGARKNSEEWGGDFILPSFTIETSIDLQGVLRDDLGREALFRPGGLMGISSDPRLFIESAVHAAKITVDEAGVEAGASTAVGLGLISAHDVIMVDRPFLYVIQDNDTGAVLFLGRVLDPSV